MIGDRDMGYVVFNIVRAYSLRISITIEIYCLVCMYGTTRTHVSTRGF